MLAGGQQFYLLHVSLSNFSEGRRRSLISTETIVVVYLPASIEVNGLNRVQNTFLEVQLTRSAKANDINAFHKCIGHCFEPQVNVVVAGL